MWDKINSFSLTGKKRLALWTLLILLTLLIFLYPAQLTSESHPIESIYVFDNLSIFSALYIIWFFTLLALALSYGTERTDNLEKIALLCIFTVVFSGLWVSLRHSYAGEAAREAFSIAYLNQYGQIPLALKIYPTDFPGVAIIGSTISQMTGLADFDVLTTLQMLYILLFPAMLYLVFKNIIRDSRWSVLMVLLVINGGIMIAKQLSIFHPSSFAIFFLFTPFLLLLTMSQRSNSGTWQNVLFSLILLILLAVAVTHFVTTACLLLVLLGVFIVQQFSKKKIISLPMVLLCAVILISWQVLKSTYIVDHLVNNISRIIDDFRHGVFVSGYAASLVSAYTREDIPIWANITRYFWLASLIVFAAILGIKNLFQAKALTAMGTWVTGGLIGIGILLIGIALLSGMEEINRTLVYAPFFTIPIIAIFFYKMRNHIRTCSFVAVAVILLVLSLPTFLAHNNTVGTTAYYSYELSGYDWLKSQYGDRGEVYIAGGQFPLCYYIERSHYHSTSLQFVEGKNEAGYWEEYNKLVKLSQDKDKDIISLFVIVESRVAARFKHLLNVDIKTSPEWGKLKSRLAQEDLIYNNGYVEFYKAVE